jgi:hypothetical protein
MADSSITPRFYKLGPALGIPRLAKNHSLIQLFINNALAVMAATTMLFDRRVRAVRLDGAVSTRIYGICDQGVARKVGRRGWLR